VKITDNNAYVKQLSAVG